MKISEDKQSLVETFFPKFCSYESIASNKLKNPDSESSHILTNKRKGLHLCQHSKSCKICNVTMNNLVSNTEKVEKILDIHHKVKESGLPNFLGCKFPVNEKINIDYMRSLLVDYCDIEVCDLLEFGFPLGCNDNETLLSSVKKNDLWKYKNHRGADDFPEDILLYLEKESNSNAILGPFNENPFQSGLKISPLNSVPKKDTTERRIILDLSCPRGLAVNNFINNEEYFGRKMDLVYPKVDDFIQLIKAKGRGCLLYKIDLRKAFRQIKICPSQYNLVSYIWKKHIFCDTVLSMGAKSSAYCCQRVTNAISFIMFQIGVCILNYLDDLASADTVEKASFSFNTLRAILNKCGIEEAKNKACPPSTVMIFIGILFNTVKMTIEVTPERLQEIKFLLNTWLNKETACLKEVQSLLGKLNFIAACVRPGRIFISRMLKWLRALHLEESRHKQVQIPNFVKKDVMWWYKFLPIYNGVSLMLYEEWCEPDEICSSDSSLQGCGGFWQGKYFHTAFPEKFHNDQFHITILEMFAVIICLKLWGCNFKGKRIQMFCDNQSICQVVNSGKARAEILQDCLREIAFLAAVHEFQIKMVHLESKANRISDCLSRWDIDYSHRVEFFAATQSYDLVECHVPTSFFDLIHSW